MGKSSFAALCAPSPWTGRTAATTAPKATALTGGRRGTRLPAPRQPKTRQGPGGRQGHGRRPEPLPLRGPLCPSAGDSGPAGPGPHPGPPRPPGRRLRGGVLQRRPLPNSGPGGEVPPAGGGGPVQARPAPGGQAGPRRGVRRGLGSTTCRWPTGWRTSWWTASPPWPSRSFGGC